MVVTINLASQIVDRRRIRHGLRVSMGAQCALVEFAAADAQEDGVLNAAPGGVPAHGEGGDDAVLRR